MKTRELGTGWKTFLTFSAAITFSLLLVDVISAGVDVLRMIVEGMFLTGLLSMVFIYLVSPLVVLLERGRMGRLWAVVLTYVIVFGGIGLLLGFGWPGVVAEVRSLKADLPVYRDKLSGLVTLVVARLDFIPYFRDFDIGSELMPAVAPYLNTALRQMTMSIVTVLSLLVTVPLFSFFLLADGQQFKKTMYSLVPNRYFEMTMDMMAKINVQLRSFIRGRVIEAFFVGLTIVVGLLLVDLKYAAVLGAFAGVANLVPYVGPIVGMAPGLFIALVELDSTGEILWVFVLYILIGQVIVDAFILIPILISKVANLHPLVVFLSIIIGGQLQGVLGMIIAVPVVNIFFIVVKEIYRYLLKGKVAFHLP